MNPGGRSDAVVRLPGADGVLMSASRAAVFWSAVLMSVLSAVAAAVLVFACGTDPSVAVGSLAVPFLLLGIYGYVRSGHWFFLSASVVLPAVLYFADPVCSWICLILMLGTQGVVVVSDAVQRLTFFRFCHVLEFHSTRCKKGPAGSFLAFAVGLPRGYDTRNLVMDPHAMRDRFPWKDISKISMLALLFSLPVLTVLAVSSGDTVGLPASLGVLSVCGLYAAVLAVPFSVLLSLRLGLRSGKGVFDVSGGITGTAVRMLVAGTVCITVAAVSSGMPPEGACILLSSVLLTLVLTGVSCVMYCAVAEAPLVRDIAGSWESELPLGRFGDKAGRAGGFGTPGTPERDCGSCYRNRGDQ